MAADHAGTPDHHLGRLAQEEANGHEDEALHALEDFERSTHTLDPMVALDQYRGLRRVCRRMHRRFGAVAIRALEQAIEGFDRLGADREAADTLTELAHVAHHASTHNTSRQLIEQARDIYVRIGALDGAAECDLMLAGQLTAGRGELAEGMALLQSAMATFASLGNDRGVAQCQRSLAKVHARRGDYIQAEELLDSAATAFAAANLWADVALCRQASATIAEDRGQLVRARELLTKAKDAYTAAGADLPAAGCDMSLGYLARELGDVAGAGSAFLAAMEVFGRVGDAGGIARVNMALGSLFRHMGRLEDALAFYEHALGILRRIGAEAELAGCEDDMAIVMSELGDHEGAAAKRSSAKEAYVRLGFDLDAVGCDMNAGVSALQLRNYDEAWDLLRQARDGYLRLESWIRLARCETAIGRCLVGQAGLAEGDARRELQRKALEYVLPAALALDAMRFELSSQLARRLWADGEVSSAFSLALQTAHELGDVELVAEIIEHRRAYGSLGDANRSQDLSAEAPIVWVLEAAAEGAEDRRDPQWGDSGDGHGEGSATLSPALSYLGVELPGFSLTVPGLVDVPMGTGVGLRGALETFHWMALDRGYPRTSADLDRPHHLVPLDV